MSAEWNSVTQKEKEVDTIETLACVASVSVGLGFFVCSKHFSLSGCAKIGPSAKEDTTNCFSPAGKFPWPGLTLEGGCSVASNLRDFREAFSFYKDCCLMEV